VIIQRNPDIRFLDGFARHMVIRDYSKESGYSIHRLTSGVSFLGRSLIGQVWYPLQNRRCHGHRLARASTIMVATRNQ
jgi:hypothetical protein